MNLWRKIKNALWAILGLFTAILLFLRQKKPPNIEKAEKALDESKKTAGEIAKNKKEREKAAQEFKEKLKKIMGGTLILLILFCVPVMAYVPETYEDAVEYYQAAVEAAVAYQQLYEQAEADVDLLLAENEKLSAELKSMIQYTKPKFGMTAGAIISTRPAAYIGIIWQF